MRLSWIQDLQLQKDLDLLIEQSKKDCEVYRGYINIKSRRNSKLRQLIKRLSSAIFL